MIRVCDEVRQEGAGGRHHQAVHLEVLTLKYNVLFFLLSINKINKKDLMVPLQIFTTSDYLQKYNYYDYK